VHGRKWQTGEATVLDIKPAPHSSEYGTILETRIHPHDGGEAFWVDVPCPRGTRTMRVQRGTSRRRPHPTIRST
jgi:hypothetical protein